MSYSGVLQFQHVVFINHSVIDLFAQQPSQFKNLDGHVVYDGVMMDYVETH